MSPEEIIKKLSGCKEEIRKKYGVILVGIFGSLARREEIGTSDLDILVEIEKPIGLKFFELWDELESLLGCKVDVLTVNAVKQKPLFWESIKRDLVSV